MIVAKTRNIVQPRKKSINSYIQQLTIDDQRFHYNKH